MFKTSYKRQSVCRRVSRTGHLCVFWNYFPPCVRYVFFFLIVILCTTCMQLFASSHHEPVNWIDLFSCLECLTDKLLWGHVSWMKEGSVSQAVKATNTLNDNKDHMTWPDTVAACVNPSESPVFLHVSTTCFCTQHTETSRSFIHMWPPLFAINLTLKCR